MAQVQEREIDVKEPEPSLTYAEFLDFVAEHPDEQYEYVNGRPVAMGRPSTMHQRIAGEIFAALKAHLRGQRCDVYFDVRTWVGDRDRIPDVAVTCDEYDIAEATNVIHSPKLVIEVVSPKRGDDLDVKIKQYESRPSIEEYVIIDSRRRWLQRHWRDEPLAKFTTDPVRIAGSVILTSVNYMLDIDELYRLVRF
jgi:Uma2 family endonuclease